MNTKMYFHIPQQYKAFAVRILHFVRTNYVLYIPDLIIITLLAVPPYSTGETLALVTGLVILGFRDIMAMRYMKHYLMSFQVKNAEVYISLLKYDRRIDISSHISRINMRFMRGKRISRLQIYDGDQLIHQQYAIGYWTRERLMQLNEKYGNLKKDVDLSIMFRGTTLN